MTPFVVSVIFFNGKKKVLNIRANSEEDAFQKAAEEVNGNYHSLSIPVIEW
ncbi:hypothetical protein [Lentibacillus salinarum]|uniref:Uncharacterized protein n=1 Tax=Lentibacillus salinarum TaxID=446820 RepID=A0ABW3ZYR2_9BACI